MFFQIELFQKQKKRWQKGLANHLTKFQIKITVKQGRKTKFIPLTKKWMKMIGIEKFKVLV